MAKESAKESGNGSKKRKGKRGRMAKGKRERAGSQRLRACSGMSRMSFFNSLTFLEDEQLRSERMGRKGAREGAEKGHEEEKLCRWNEK